MKTAGFSKRTVGPPRNSLRTFHVEWMPKLTSSREKHACETKMPMYSPKKIFNQDLQAAGAEPLSSSIWVSTALLHPQNPSYYPSFQTADCPASVSWCRNIFPQFAPTHPPTFPPPWCVLRNAWLSAWIDLRFRAEPPTARGWRNLGEEARGIFVFQSPSLPLLARWETCGSWWVGW